MPRSRPRRPPDVTPAALERSALYYLERYASSAENLRRVLMRRVERAARADSADRSEARAQVDALIQRLRERKLLDDNVYAEGRARSLSRKGRSRAGIARTLAAKGVDRDTVDAALEELAETGETDLMAALRFARRRRLGPYREPNQRAVRRDRDLAALGRAGFSYEVARLVVDAATPEALEEAVAGA